MASDDPQLIGANGVTTPITTRRKTAKERLIEKNEKVAEGYLLRFRFDPSIDKEKDVTSVPCPFTGQPVILKAVSNGFWMGVGPFYTTKLFNFKRELIWHLAQRPWHMPDFSPRPEVSVRERLPEYKDNLGPEGDRRDKDARVQATVDELVERSAKQIGLRK